MSTTLTRPGMTRIGIVEDHVRYREALQATIDSMPDIEVAWIAEDGFQAMNKMADDPVDLAVVDVSLPGENGIVLIGRIRSNWPSTSCVVLSGHTEPTFVQQSFDAGAMAYVVKGRPGDLRDGIDAGRDRRRYVSPQLSAND